MDDNYIRYGVMIASISGTEPNLYVGDKAFYELIEAIKPFKNRLGVHYTYRLETGGNGSGFF